MTPRRLLMLFVLASLTLVPLRAATAQVQEIEETFVVPLADRTPLRSGSDEVWYPVTLADSDRVLRADGEADGYYAVEYPRGVPVVIMATSGELTNDGEVVRLTRDIEPFAYNAETPTTGAIYKKVTLPRLLRAGTEMSFLGTLEDNQGMVGAFLVEAPDEGPRAFIRQDLVRKATPVEIDRFRRSLLGAQPIEQPQETPGPATTVTERMSDDAGEAVAIEPDVTAPEELEPEPVEEIVMGETPERDAETEAVDTISAQPESPAEVEQPEQMIEDASGEASSSEQAQPEVDPRELTQLERLDLAFAAVLEEPMLEAEYSELIEEFRAYRDDLPAGYEGDLAREYADARIAVLELRAGAQRTNRAVAALEAAADTSASEIERRVSEVRATALFDYVGRLVPSAIYDGERLPLHFRLVSVQPGSPRTIVYIRPMPGIDIDAHLGNIVGVRGNARDGTDRRVPIIDPDSIDPVRAEN